MPELNWNEYDFVECLGVLPKIEEYGVEYFFKVIQGDLEIEIGVWPYESVIEIALFQKTFKDYLIRLHLLVLGHILYVNEKRDSYLEFNECFPVSDRFYYLRTDADLVNKKDLSGIKVKLQMFPQFQLRFE